MLSITTHSKNDSFDNAACPQLTEDVRMTQPVDPQKPDKTQETTMNSAVTPPAVPIPAPASTGIKQPRQIRSETLLNGDRELQIIHGDEIYRLSVTRQGKLILHK